MFCAWVKITLDVQALQTFLFSEEGWVGLSGYGIPNSALLILRFASVDTLQLSLFTRNCDTVIWYHKNYALLFSWNILPKAQPGINSYWLHISYFLQNCKKGKPSEISLPFLKNDITNILGLWYIHVHSRTHKVSAGCDMVWLSQ